MEYAADDLKPHERYKLLAGFVLPRPIAWITTVGPTGVVNAAPYSFFNVFCEDPPLCMFAVNPRPDQPSLMLAGDPPHDSAEPLRVPPYALDCADAAPSRLA